MGAPPASQSGTDRPISRARASVWSLWQPRGGRRCGDFFGVTARAVDFGSVHSGRWLSIARVLGFRLQEVGEEIGCNLAARNLLREAHLLQLPIGMHHDL